MFENLCTLPLQSDIFATALHPCEALLAVGLASGHVEAFRLPGQNSKDGRHSTSNDGKDTVESVWKTRRHKGSCRSLAFSHDGRAMYSAGTDSLVKYFDSNSGEVVSKMLVPSTTPVTDAPTLLHVLNPQCLLLATDLGALHLFDLRDGDSLRKPSQTHFPHLDYVSSITTLPASEESATGLPKQWISTGGTTLAVTDVRRGVMIRSEDQEDELLSACFMTGMGPKNHRNNGMAVVGSGSGVLTLWDKGSWDDQQERIIVDGGKGGGESVDAMTKIPEHVSRGKKVVCGMGDGSLRIVDIIRRKVDRSTFLRHDDMDAVVSLGFDNRGRLISAGGPTVKIWDTLSGLPEENDSEDTGQEGLEEPGLGDNHDEIGDSDESDGGNRERADGFQRRLKRRKDAHKGKLGPMGAHGILGFEGLD